MYNPMFPALCIGGTAILLAGSVACDGASSTSTISTDVARGRLSEGARFAGTYIATLELNGASGGFGEITLSRSHFDVTMPYGKTGTGSKDGEQGRLFVLRDATSRGVLSPERDFSYNDRQGRAHSLRIQRLAGNGPISRIKHYRDGALVARLARSWRSVRGGWVATASTLDVVHAGEVVGRVSSSVRTTELATRERAANGIDQLVALAHSMLPAALHAQRVNRCQSQLAGYGDAYAQFSVLIVETAPLPIVDDNFRQISDAYERFEQASSELQRCLMRPAG